MSTRGASGFSNVLERMGGAFSIDALHDGIDEHAGDLAVVVYAVPAVAVDEPAAIASIIDEIPMLAVAATQAEGRTEMRGAGELRHKESDRIAAIARNLRAMGATIEEFEDGFAIEGPTRLHGCAVSSFGDHRIAMAMAVAGLVAEGRTEIDDASVVEISYPKFFRGPAHTGSLEEAMSAEAKSHLFGLIGDPVAHSLSPFIMNRAFDMLGLDAMYVGFGIRPERLEPSLAGSPRWGSSGFNVTYPYKEEILYHVDAVSAEVEVINAVNTVAYFDDEIQGYNTDAAGTAIALETFCRRGAGRIARAHLRHRCVGARGGVRIDGARRRARCVRDALSGERTDGGREVSVRVPRAADFGRCPRRREQCGCTPRGVPRFEHHHQCHTRRHGRAARWSADRRCVVDSPRAGILRLHLSSQADLVHRDGATRERQNTRRFGVVGVAGGGEFPYLDRPRLRHQGDGGSGGRVLTDGTHAGTAGSTDGDSISHCGGFARRSTDRRRRRDCRPG